MDEEIKETPWEPDNPGEDDPQPKKSEQKGKRTKEKPPEAPEKPQKPSPPERVAVWVCKECGGSWKRPRISCNMCGGPVGRFQGTQEEIARYSKHIQERRRRGQINT